ncbi:hypothetical protein C8Q75DRAFT_776004 [Abortiporus biennis]|nr:hypothetical protein C8Q75DRAFT_776004 [Abortiporus biennis]
MERLESLGNALSQITMYDIKSMYNQAKNVVLNVSEMEAKVREATNDEPWGASSTLMQEIAQGTFNFQNFNEIMPSIYARFMEKEAKQWRQIYKALQLLEYLVKNGSERVVDDARSHIATIKMLRNFYYIDEKGKDQGLNVRNRSKELVELLGDVDKIRAERRKAKNNKNKYIGTGNDGMAFSSGGRYGGFGSDSYSSYSGGGGGGGSSSGGYGDNYSGRDYDSYSGGGGSSSFRDSTSRRNYEEYEAGDDDTVAARRSDSISRPSQPRRSNTGSSLTAPAKAPEHVPAPAPIVDLLGMDDDFSSAPAPAPPATTNKALPAVVPSFDNDDDFGGFQDAPSPAPAATSFFNAPVAAAPTVPAVAPAIAPSTFIQPARSMSQPIVPAASGSANLFSMITPATTASPPPMGMATSRPPPYMAQTAMTPTSANPMFSNSAVMTPSAFPSRSTPGITPAQRPASAAAAKPTSSGGGFEDLWTMSLGSAGGSASKAPAAGPAKSMKDLEKEKAQANIWGAGQPKSPLGAGFGSFGNASGATTSTAAPAAASNPLDDLLF